MSISHVITFADMKPSLACFVLYHGCGDKVLSTCSYAWGRGPYHDKGSSDRQFWFRIGLGALDD